MWVMYEMMPTASSNRQGAGMNGKDGEDSSTRTVSGRAISTGKTPCSREMEMGPMRGWNGSEKELGSVR